MYFLIDLPALRECTVTRVPMTATKTELKNISSSSD